MPAAVNWVSSLLWFSYAYAFWSQHASPASSYRQKVLPSHGAGGACLLAAGAVLSHSPLFVWALPPTWPTAHGWSTDNQRQEPQFAVKSPLNLVFARFKAWGNISDADLHHLLTCIWGCPPMSLSCLPCQEICHLPPCPGTLSILREGTVPLHHQWDVGCVRLLGLV